MPLTKVSRSQNNFQTRGDTLYKAILHTAKVLS